MSITSIVEKEFPAELAGENVGWITVDPHGDGFLCVNVVTAKVGSRGASFVIEAIESDGETKIVSDSDATSGFVAVSGLCLYLNKENGDLKNSDYFNSTYGSAASDILFRGAGIFKNFEPKTPKVWAESGVELFSGLKDMLDEHGALQFFPNVYYNLNGHIGRKGERRYQKYEDLLVADPSMTETTSQQQAKAAELIEHFGSMIASDKEMQRCLTVYSHIPAAAVPEVFEASRRSMAVAEINILQMIKDLVAKDFYYLPVGFRPSGRSWPYMDPTESDERMAFGNQLNALKSENTTPANRELVRELDELGQRMQHATIGQTVLTALAKAETEAVQR